MALAPVAFIPALAKRSLLENEGEGSSFDSRRSNQSQRCRRRLGETSVSISGPFGNCNRRLRRCTRKKPQATKYTIKDPEEVTGRRASSAKHKTPRRGELRALLLCVALCRAYRPMKCGSLEQKLTQRHHQRNTYGPRTEDQSFQRMLHRHHEGVYADG